MAGLDLIESLGPWPTCGCWWWGITSPGPSSAIIRRRRRPGWRLCTGGWESAESRLEAHKMMKKPTGGRW